jgi:hypothetical protein
MNPWGWLDGAGTSQERLRLRGNQTTGRDIKAAVLNMAHAGPTRIVSLAAVPLRGRLYFTTTTAAGERQRLDAAGAPAPLLGADLAFIAEALAGQPAYGVPQLMTREDDYYFTHHRDVASLPVYRMVLPGDAATRYYLDTVSGALMMKVDRGARAYRWLHEGLHRMDFTPMLRQRPQWDALMLLLMCGATALCASGAYLGVRRLARSRRD